MLLDIEMREMNGIELAQRIRTDNKALQIIFVTGYMEYIGEGYDVEALHYLLKPVTREKLFPVFTRAAEHLKYKENSLILNTSEGTVNIPLHEIKYLEVNKNYVTVHADIDYTVKKTLNELEEKLDDSFIRSGRSYIVNIRRIKCVTRTDILLKSGEAIPIARKMYETINQAIIKYF